MTTSTIVERRRRLARCTHLIASSILAFCITSPILAGPVAPSPIQSGGSSTADQTSSATTKAPAQRSVAASSAGTAAAAEGGDLSADAASSTDDTAPPKTFSMTPTGVNLLNLSYVNEVNDLAMGPLTLTRSYISGKVDSGQYFGYSWTHNFDIWARQYTAKVWSYSDAQDLTEIIVGRTVHRFYGLATGSYPPAPENDETGSSVSSSNGAIIFNDRDGTIYQFDGNGASQKVSAITSPDGTVLSFAYTADSAKRLKTVTSNRGYAIVFDYAGGNVSAACGYNLSRTAVTTSSSCTGAAVSTYYSYNGANLASVTGVTGQTTQYQYQDTSSASNAPSYLTCLIDPGASSCKITNTWTRRNDTGLYVVSKQVTADNATWQFDCSCGANGRSDPDDTQPVEWTSVVEPTTASTYTEFTSNVLSKHVDENGQTYPLGYFGRLPVTMTYPEGNTIVWNYNPNTYAETSRVLKAKPNTQLPDISLVTKTYPTSYNAATRDLPIAVTDANGNETDNGYTAFGAIDWTMQPPPSPGGARPVKLYAYTQKYAYVSNGSGSLVPTSTAIWLPSSETQCQTVSGVAPDQPRSRPVCDTSSPVVITTYEYGVDGTADNLLMRGKVVSSGGVTLRTCYRYDVQGNKIAETSPRAGLSSCPA